jgi:aminoglycoside 6-adenylyltransferase
MRGSLADGMRHLEERFVAWADARPDVRAAIVVGSRARNDHPADEWADLDIGFTTTQPRRYFHSDDWLSELGTVWVAYRDPLGITRHVLFEGGLDAGLAPISHGQLKLATRFVPLLRRFAFLYRLPGLGPLRSALIEAGEHYRRGGRIILDKDGIAERFLALLPQVDVCHGLPTAAEFEALVNEFWFAAVWTAKHLRRGELWWAKCSGSDGRMKTLLLRMIEWHARAARGQDVDTWEGGRFLEEWADARVLERLAAAFAHYDAADVERALLATMNLFRWLATDVADRLNYPYPTASDEYVTMWVTDCLSGQGPGPRSGS